MDALTQSWIRNTADEKAAATGMRFDLTRAAWTCWWIGRYCRLYEGSHAGEPLYLRGAHSQPLFASQEPWAKGGKEETIQYIRDYMEARAGGEPCDWQLEVTCRIYGWINFDNHWQQWIRRFNRGITFVAKKNKKSPMIAANGLYMLCGDREQGQKIYLCATTGDQAREIAGQHAVQMVLASRELTAACKIEAAKAIIRHIASNSTMKPLSSGNVMSQKAQEGLNGSGFVDEAHVVSAAYIARISRMGISRKQPLLLGFSTVGDEQTTWGYLQWDFGTRNNLSGEDLHFFFQSYEAKQTASDAEIAAHLDDYIRAANPALGHTVRIEEVRQDYATSIKNEKTKRDFYKYRLNIWGQSKNQWLSSDLWNSSEARRWKTAAPKDPCWGALYLGYVDEPAALTLIWPNDPISIDRALAATAKKTANNPSLSALRYPLSTLNPQPSADHQSPLLMRALDQKMRARTYYWLPKKTIEQYGHALPYDAWRQSKCCTMLPGDALDMDRLAADIIKIMRGCDVQAMAYDPNREGVLLGAVCEAGHYPEKRCFEFRRQTSQRWTFSIAMLERLLLGGKLKHRQNVALDWEVGHAEIKPDRLGGAYLIEPIRGDRQTVAGPASLLMALDAMGRAKRFYKSQLFII